MIRKTDVIRSANGEMYSAEFMAATIKGLYGLNVRPSTLVRYARHKQIPRTKIMGKYYFYLADVEEALGLNSNDLLEGL